MSREAVRALQPHTRPLWFAGVVTGVVVPLAYWAVLAVMELARTGSLFGDAVMRGLGAMVLVGIPICLLATFCLGYPLVRTLKTLGRLRPLPVCAGASAIGALLMAVIPFFLPFERFEGRTVIIGALSGMIAGVVFTTAAGIPFRQSSP